MFDGVDLPHQNKWRVDMKIDGMLIREVDGNLYNLNDLHKSSGGLDKHKPSLFMQNKQTIDLANEVSKVKGFLPFKKVMGRTGGTYVCKELVYAYAMWVSAEFNLRVINEFDASVNRNAKIDDGINRLGVAIARSADELRAAADEVALSLSEIKKHGSDWGSYGAAIRKARADATKKLNAVKAEIQLKLDLLG